MLCLAGDTPVANVDQATGDWGGNVVRRRWKDPWLFNWLRFGILPSAMNRSVKPGSRPSRPRKIARLTFARPKPRFRRRTAHAVRNGHAIKDPTVRNSETARLRNDPRNAK